MGSFYFNVSLHDISPVREKEARLLFRLCAECGINYGTLLVVPDWHGQHPLQRRLPLVQWLQELSRTGWEIVLHGHEHLMSEPGRLNILQRLIAYHYTNCEGEFYLLSGDQAHARIARGLQMLRDCGLKPGGFVAPAWLMSQETLQALRQTSLSFTTTLSSVYDLQRGRRYFAPVQAFSSRGAGRVLASVVSGSLAGHLWAGLPFVRVALHPSDLDSPPVIKTARRLLQRLARQRTCLLLDEYVRLQAVSPEILSHPGISLWKKGKHANL